MSSRKEEKEALRRERVEREQQAAASERRKRLVGYGAAGVLAVAALAAIVVVLLSGGDGDGGGAPEQASAGEFPQGSVPPVQTTDLDEAVEAADCKLEESEPEGNEHVTDPVTYKANPPSSGDHFVEPAADGAYTTAPRTEQLLHALEHGRILIQYKPDAPDSVKGDLKALYDEDPYHMLIAPNETDMPYQVAATTWTRTLGCTEMNDQVFDAIRAFREEFRDQGPEFIP